MKADKALARPAALMVDNPVWEICERVAEVQALLDDHYDDQQGTRQSWWRQESEGRQFGVFRKVDR
jgi:hypothetical protein